MFARTRALAAEKERAKSIAANKQFNSPSLLIMVSKELEKSHT